LLFVVVERLRAITFVCLMLLIVDDACSCARWFCRRRDARRDAPMMLFRASWRALSAVARYGVMQHARDARYDWRFDCRFRCQPRPLKIVSVADAPAAACYAAAIFHARLFCHARLFVITPLPMPMPGRFHTRVLIPFFHALPRLSLGRWPRAPRRFVAIKNASAMRLRSCYAFD